MTTIDRDGSRIPCNELVELITDYLDGALAPEVVGRIDAHLELCAGCASVLDQFRATIRTAGQLRAHDVDRLTPSLRGSLVEAFRVHAVRRPEEH